MNFRKLITYLTMGTAAAMPLAVAQNPTILQGNYITNVFGNSNFVLNPNAQTNVANVTTSSATVTRSTTTPLVATSEFNITTSTSTGYADWSLRSFDQGMKNNNCEARFTYRGFSVGSTTAQILQGANVVAQLTLTAATDPRIASINFPCGDLSAVTKFRLQQATASLTGTNEIGGIYVGLATNMANVAQAVEYGSVTMANCSSVWTTSGSGTQWESFPTRTNCTYSPTGNASAPSTNIPAIQFSNLPIGNYQIVLSGAFGRNSATSASIYFRARSTDGTFTSNSAIVATTTTAQNQYAPTATFNLNITSSGSRTIEIQAFNQGTSTAAIIANGTTVNDTTQITVYRFPSSSELVVKPETQNVFGQARYFGTALIESKFSTVVPSISNYVTVGTGSGAQNWATVRSLKGKAVAPSTTSSQALGLRIPSLPVGNFLVTIRGDMKSVYPTSNANFYSVCGFDIFEATTSTSISANNSIASSSPGSPLVFAFPQSNLRGVFTNTSVADREFVLRAAKTQDNTTGQVATCDIVSSNNPSGTISEVTIDVIPLDQPSNSALYVQGPVLGSQTGAAIPSGYQMEGVANANNLSLTNGQLIRDLSTFVPGVRVTQITRTLTPGNYLATADITCDNMPSGTGLVLYMVSDGTTFAISRNISPIVGGYVSNSVTRYLRVTNNMVYKIDAEAGGVISGTCATVSTVLRLN